MIYGITSKSELKVNVVKNAYTETGYDEYLCYSANSGVGEQPVGDQTLTGARNRIADLNKKNPGLDKIISIENGIFHENGIWIDRGVIVIYNPISQEEIHGFSEGVAFPTEYVEQARKIGFDTMTVGEVMAKAGHIKNSKDPHICISGRTRQELLEETLKKLIS